MMVKGLQRGWCKLKGMEETVLGGTELEQD